MLVTYIISLLNSYRDNIDIVERGNGRNSQACDPHHKQWQQNRTKSTASQISFVKQ